jgi:hypothetical protein
LSKQANKKAPSGAFIGKLDAMSEGHGKGKKRLRAAGTFMRHKGSQ